MSGVIWAAAAGGTFGLFGVDRFLGGRPLRAQSRQAPGAARTGQPLASASLLATIFAIVLVPPRAGGST